MSNQIEKSGFEDDTRNAALNKLRQCFRRIDEVIKKNEWDNLEDELLKRLSQLEEANEDLGNARSTRQLIDFQRQAEKIIQKKDILLGKDLLGNINSLFFALTWQKQTKLWLQEWNEDFDDINWEVGR